MQTKRIATSYFGFYLSLLFLSLLLVCLVFLIGCFKRPQRTQHKQAATNNGLSTASHRLLSFCVSIYLPIHAILFLFLALPLSPRLASASIRSQHFYCLQVAGFDFDFLLLFSFTETTKSMTMEISFAEQSQKRANALKICNIEIERWARRCSTPIPARIFIPTLNGMLRKQSFLDDAHRLTFNFAVVDTRIVFEWCVCRHFEFESITLRTQHCISIFNFVPMLRILYYVRHYCYVIFTITITLHNAHMHIVHVGMCSGFIGKRCSAP